MPVLNCAGIPLVIDRPVVMGIINITPDSFFEESRKQTIDEVLFQAEKMLEEGASILDVGGQSTRPGSVLIEVDEEARRIMPVISALKARFSDAVISVDTYHSQTAKLAVAEGANMINDISGGLLDVAMIETVGVLNVPYVCMHMRGNPVTMNLPENLVYDDLITDITDFFIKQYDLCKKAGIKDVILDPGFGFSKTIAQNFELVKRLNDFSGLDLPVLLGVSRKSSIVKTLNVTVESALNGTTVLNTIGLMNGASILRVHDVKEAVECVKLFNMMYR
ncbi:dihydropteroate synthase [Polluticaenibacter yanchengensis]|uniref:dihydropteroate synthase n=1 Tax=Polluticaenibacter yanchengensis TaxID=3014562 RepID=A0ABT4UKW4_9BACT|nr:dihydropteroate synthase [Chitinophagaceae bacterium LY-5]